MKIVAVAASRIPSDTANSIQVMKACHAMAQLGHDVTLILPDDGHSEDRSWDEMLGRYGISTPFAIEWLPLRNRRLFTFQAVWRARALRPNLLYTWPIQSAVFGALAGIPTLFEAHEPPSGSFGPLWYALFVRIPVRKRVASITAALQSILEKKYGTLPPGAAVIAPNGVELERFSATPDEPSTARRQTGLPDLPTVVCTGHLYAGRGVELFVALARLLPQAQFVWVGGRPQDVQAWQARVADVANLTFTGFISNDRLPLYQAAADVLLMPYGSAIAGSSGGDSAAVASPMKMFEYMAAGRAIVSSDLPVIREVLNESSAVFCPPDNAPVWQSALESLLADDDRRRALGQQARADAQGYTWVERARKILEGFGSFLR